MSDRTGNPGPNRLEEWEQRAEGTLFAASLVFLTGYAVRVLAPRDSGVWRDLGLALSASTWLLFLLDYAVRLRLSGLGRRFVHTYWLDTLVLLLPLLRPLRMVKVYEALQKRHARPRLSLYARVMAYASLTALLLGFSAALAVYQQERGAPGTTIRTFGDAVWWACETLTTVGYGDAVPVTAGGRSGSRSMSATTLAGSSRRS